MKKLILLILIVSLLAGCTATQSSIIDLNGKSGTVEIKKGGEYQISGTLADGMIYVDSKDDVVLNLNGVEIKNENGPAIFIDNAKSATIVLAENTKNYLSDGNNREDEELDAVVLSNANLIISGTGSLIVNAAFDHAITTEEVLTVKSGDIKIKTEKGKGLKGEKEVLIENGNIDIESVDEAIESKGELTINDGTINIVSGEDGINAGTSDSKKEEQGNQEMPNFPEGERPEFPARQKRDTSAMQSIIINGGKIAISSVGDGIDSNGNLYINGGEIIIDGPVAMDNSPLDADGELLISGGTVITTSSAGMVQAPKSENQGLLRATFKETLKSQTKISIKDANENKIMSLTSKKDFQALIFSSDKLKDGTYTLYVNDEKYEEFTVENNRASIGGFGRGGFGGFGGRPQRREFKEGERPNFPEGERPGFPEGERPQRREFPEGERPEGFGGRRNRPSGENNQE